MHSTAIINRFLILFLLGAIPAIVILVLGYRFRVGEDSDAVYTSVRLGTALFAASFGSTVISLAYGISTVY
jgi:hypothetical protein